MDSADRVVQALTLYLEPFKVPQIGDHVSLEALTLNSVGEAIPRLKTAGGLYTTIERRFSYVAQPCGHFHPQEVEPVVIISILLKPAAPSLFAKTVVNLKSEISLDEPLQSFGTPCWEGGEHEQFDGIDYVATIELHGDGE